MECRGLIDTCTHGQGFHKFQCSALFGVQRVNRHMHTLSRIPVFSTDCHSTCLLHNQRGAPLHGTACSNKMAGCCSSPAKACAPSPTTTSSNGTNRRSMDSPDADPQRVAEMAGARFPASASADRTVARPEAAELRLCKRSALDARPWAELRACPTAQRH